MDEARRQALIGRAHAIWEREGRPEGEAERHWAMAEEELRAEEGGPAAEAPALKPARTARKAKPTPRAEDERPAPDVGVGEELAVAGRDAPAAMPAGEAARTAKKSTSKARKADSRVRS